MDRVRTAKVDYFAIAIDGGLIILATVMAEVTFHQPRLCMMRINLQNTIDKDFGDLPSFFGNRTHCV